MEKNPVKFRLMSTGRYIFAELDGKTLGPGITDLSFSATDEGGSLNNQLNLRINLSAFEFLPDGAFDEKYKKYQEATAGTEASVKR